MGKEVVNRREKLLASEIPPEIPDVSGFVKNTDKATASALGLVKIGDNIDVSSAGKISVPVGSSETFGVMKAGNGVTVNDGVISVASGGGLDLLYTAPDPAIATSNEITLSANASNYKFLIIVIKTSDSSTSTTLFISTEVTPYVAYGKAYGSSAGEFKFTITDDKIKQNSPTNANNLWALVYGLK